MTDDGTVAERRRLRDGSTVEDPRLDRLPDLAPENRRHEVRRGAAELPGPRSKVWRLPRTFYGDQGREGACVEFGLLHVLAALTVAQALEVLRRIRREHLVYFPAQRRDPWAGGSYPEASPFYEGTSELAGMLVLRDLGFIEGFDWSFSFDDSVANVCHRGAANVALNWTEGMGRPRPSGLIRDEGRVVGGHDLAWIGVLLGHKLPGEPRLDLAVLAQSWGLDHGDRGRVYLPLEDLHRRVDDDGTVAFLRGERRLEPAQLQTL